MRGAVRARVVLVALAATSAVPALSAEPAPPARPAEAVVQWDAAEQHVGRAVTVEGQVVGVHCSPTSCLLAFDPSFNRFTVVVQAKDFGRFPPGDLEDRYAGRRVRVKGTVVDRDHKPEIELSDPANLKVVETKEERAERVTARIEAQERALDRFEQMLARVEALIERLAETQDRMDTALAALEERSEALMVAAANPTVVQVPAAAGPATPAGPEPRPGWEVMRSVKRGMSAGDVRRLMGDPLNVIPGGNGWSTWLYDGGRSVSFDGRGRAQSLAGFPGS
jgi:uncharacterized protein YhaN